MGFMWGFFMHGLPPLEMGKGFRNDQTTSGKNLQIASITRAANESFTWANWVTINDSRVPTPGTAYPIQSMLIGADQMDFRLTMSANKTVTGATNAGPIVITTSAAHGLLTGDKVAIAGVVGNTAANGTFTVTVLTTTTFSLNGSTGNGAYVSGGTVSPWTGTLLWSTNVGGTNSVPTTATVRCYPGDRLWLVAVYDAVADTISMYANGTQMASTSFAESKMASGTGTVFLGRALPTGIYSMFTYGGSMTLARSVDYVQIRAAYNGGWGSMLLANFLDTDDFWFKFDGDLTDSSGNGHTAAPYTTTTAGITRTVTLATNTSPIIITTSAAHGYTTGQHLTIDAVGGNTAANGQWPVTVLTTTTFSLDGSVGNGAYTSGGTSLWLTYDNFPRVP